MTISTLPFAAICRCRDPRYAKCYVHDLEVAVEPLRYSMVHEEAMVVLKAAKPRDVVMEFPLGAATFGITHTTVIDYRPVQGPEPEPVE